MRSVRLLRKQLAYIVSFRYLYNYDCQERQSYDAVAGFSEIFLEHPKANHLEIVAYRHLVRNAINTIMFMTLSKTHLVDW